MRCLLYVKVSLMFIWTPFYSLTPGIWMNIFKLRIKNKILLRFNMTIHRTHWAFLRHILSRTTCLKDIQVICGLDVHLPPLFVGKFQSASIFYCSRSSHPHRFFFGFIIRRKKRVQTINMEQSKSSVSNKKKCVFSRNFQKTIWGFLPGFKILYIKQLHNRKHLKIHEWKKTN